MTTHDPLKFATGLSAKLATRSRHICAFLGAGASRSCGLPAVKELEAKVLAHLKGKQKEAFKKQLDGRNLEQVLSRLRRLNALLTPGQKLDEMTADEAIALDAAACQAIIQELNISGKDLSAMKRFAAWIARADYRLPIEIFTVNYDLLIETALEELRAPYFDGFVGALRARFQTELVEGRQGKDEAWMPSTFARLWKLHGSVNWAWDEKEIVRLGAPIESGRAAAIYPSDAKYDESRRVPFVVLQDRLRRSLNQAETLVLISGYSFNDAHLNELLFEAAGRRERSEFIAFCYEGIPEALATRAEATPNLQAVTGTEAILGGTRAAWKPPEGISEDLWEDGKLSLRDFSKLSTYLARSAIRSPDRDSLREAIKETIKADEH